ncbi:MAG: hypothetical protein O2887_19045 [Bacteroidetes bacterium]|nr:hypothetical protein [Bacteroidota bacterium]MDA1122551.1 hypothetical protein [Bacteroidota bacterium]
MKSYNRKAKNHWAFNLAMAAVLMCVSSCYYEDVAPVEVVVPVDPINYELEIQPFFDAKCIACHGGSISPNLSASVSYDELISGNWINTTASESSPLYMSINIGGNMEAYATPAERAIILAWIEQGAPSK